jgi:hypothetical protein
MPPPVVPKKRSNPIDIFNGRKHGVVVTDAAGNQYVLRLGHGLSIEGDTIVVGTACDRLIAGDPFEDVFTSDGEPICCEDS